MKIKFTGLYEKINIVLIENNFYWTFKRNTWYDVPDSIANILTKMDNFLTEEDLKFDKSLIKRKEVEAKKEPANKKKFRLCINRFGALGDLIMLLPVVRQLKKMLDCEVTLATQACYAKWFVRETDAFDKVITTNLYNKRDYDKTIFLDGVLEQDHSLSNEDRLMHRTILYEKFFGIEVENYDFSLHILPEEDKYVEELLNASY